MNYNFKRHISSEDLRKLSVETLAKVLKLSNVGVINDLKRKCEMFSESVVDESTIKTANMIKRYYNNELIPCMEKEIKKLIKKTTEFFDITELVKEVSQRESDYALKHLEGNYHIDINRGMGGLEQESDQMCDLLWNALINDLEGNQ